MPAPLHVIILAAGQGTRMRSALPKVLHEVGGRPMLQHVLDIAAELSAHGRHIVVGHGADEVHGRLFPQTGTDRSLRWAMQKEQKGTGHAVQQAMPNVPDDAQVLVLYGDVPLVQAATIAPLLNHKGLSLLTATLADPHGYGRIVRDADGVVANIVEERDANAAQRQINEINTGILSAPARLLQRWLGRLKNSNANGEYYLTDVVAMAAHDGVVVSTHSAREAEEVMGVNDRVQLARAERIFQRRQAEKLMRQGLTLRNPEQFELRGTLEIGIDTVIDVGVVIEGKVRLGDGVYIGPYCVIRDATIGAGTRVESHSVFDSVTVGRHCRIGPYARLRPKTQLADNVHIGNFVEVKNTRIGAGSKANHLAYLGDGSVGADVNIGAGTIFCNYDGANKHPTVIGDGVFIGSDTQLVAPVTVGKGATIGAGSTITRNVPAGGLTVARAKDQKTYANWVRPKKKK